MFSTDILIYVVIYFLNLSLLAWKSPGNSSDVSYHATRACCCPTFWVLYWPACPVWMANPIVINILNQSCSVY